MYKIGEFSLATGLSVKTLRYYDEIDLLNPGYVDPFTGYRYYTEDNLNQVRIIEELKRCFFSLEQIRNVMQDGFNKELIEDKQAELIQSVEERYAAYNQLETIKENLNQEHRRKNGGPKVKTLEKKCA